MLTVTKKILKQLKKNAASLPLTFYEASRKGIMIGREILADKELMAARTDQTVDPQQIYEIEKKILKSVNHLSRMKKIYIHEGDAGIEKYCKDVQEVHLNANKPINLHSQLL